MNNFTGTGVNSEQHSLIVYSGILVPIAPAIVLGNVFTIFTFSKRRNGSNHAHILLINLAVADILVGAISIPLLIYLMGPQNKWWAKGPRTINAIYAANDILAGFASIFSLVFIALERLHAIMFPLKHRLTTKRVYYSSIIIIWLTSALIVTIKFIFKIRTFAYVAAISFGFSLLLILVAYISLWFTVKTRKVNSAQRQMETTKDKKLAKTLILVTVVFIVTWAPFQVENFLFLICTTSQRCYHLPLVAFYTTKILQYGNSIANPILYVFRMKEFRDSFRELLHCTKNRTNTRVTNPRSNKTGEDNSAFELDTKL